MDCVADDGLSSCYPYCCIAGLGETVVGLELVRVVAFNWCVMIQLRTLLITTLLLVAGAV